MFLLRQPEKKSQYNWCPMRCLFLHSTGGKAYSHSYKQMSLNPIKGITSLCIKLHNSYFTITLKFTKNQEYFRKKSWKLENKCLAIPIRKNLLQKNCTIVLLQTIYGTKVVHRDLPFIFNPKKKVPFKAPDIFAKKAAQVT